MRRRDRWQGAEPLARDWDDSLTIIVEDPVIPNTVQIRSSSRYQAGVLRSGIGFGAKKRWSRVIFSALPSALSLEDEVNLLATNCLLFWKVRTPSTEGSRIPLGPRDMEWIFPRNLREDAIVNFTLVKLGYLGMCRDMDRWLEHFFWSMDSCHFLCWLRPSDVGRQPQQHTQPHLLVLFRYEVWKYSYCTGTVTLCYLFSVGGCIRYES
jgi:hypothetical protein